MLLPSLVFSLLAATAMWLFVRRNPATTPRLTAAALVLLLILPLLTFVPKITIALGAGAESQTISGPTLLPALWLVGFLVVAGRGLADLRALHDWKKRSRPAAGHPIFESLQADLPIPDQVSLHLHPDLASPVVCGLRRPQIHLPLSSVTWSPATLRLAVLHELGHIQRGDLPLAALARLACLFHWFNPAVWWLRRTFLAQCEYACDAFLIEKGADPRVYANALCDVAVSGNHPPLSLAMAGHVPLRKRILVLSREVRSESAFLAVLLLLTATSAIAMSVVRLVPAASDSGPAGPALESHLRFTAEPFPAD
jgi:beta-lactamase regulating signal transducer with metallopeptidase domain